MTKYNFLVTGAKGQLGSYLNEFLIRNNYSVLALGKKELDISNYSKVYDVFNSAKINWVVNCAALTNVDEIEKEEHGAIATNFEGAVNLAKISERFGSKLIHISSDAVFNSEMMKYHLTGDVKNPINKYGRTKALAENGILQETTEYWILRSSWIFSRKGSNFVNAIVSNGQQTTRSDSIEVVDDQFGQPTLVHHLADSIRLICKGFVGPGIYHVVRKEFISRYDFADIILRQMGSPVLENLKKISSDLHSNKAKRPRFSLLEPSQELVENTQLSQRDLADDVKLVIKERGIA